MSYPEPRYAGEGGELTAIFRPVGHPPELVNPSGVQVSYLATGSSTNGEFGLYRWEMGERPSGPEAHFHRTITESFYILSGTVRLYNGKQWIDGNSGDFLFVPQGGIHAFRNDSGSPASMLLLFTPGAPREDYFERVGEIAAGNEEHARAEFFLQHDTYWL